MTRTAAAESFSCGSRRPSATLSDAIRVADPALRRRASSTERGEASTRWTSYLLRRATTSTPLLRRRHRQFALGALARLAREAPWSVRTPDERSRTRDETLLGNRRSTPKLQGAG